MRVNSVTKLENIYLFVATYVQGYHARLYIYKSLNLTKVKLLRTKLRLKKLIEL